MTENKDLLKKLITDNNTKKFDNVWIDDSSDKDEIMTVSRIVQVRYRFYAVWVLLLILIVLFRLFLPALDKYDEKKAQATTLKTNLENLENRERQYVIINHLWKRHALLREIYLPCLNLRKNQFLPWWKTDRGTNKHEARSYFRSNYWKIQI